jgi:hypothetical protein
MLAMNSAQAQEPDFEVSSATLMPANRVLLLDAQLRVALPEGARQAIVDGVALTMRVEFELLRTRRWWLDATVASLEQNYEIVYHALSENFLVRNLNSGEQSSYDTLDAALDALASIRDLPALDQSLLESNEEYLARLRASLDVRTLPDTLRLVLFWTDDWRQRTAWYTWSLKP